MDQARYLVSQLLEDSSRTKRELFGLSDVNDLAQGLFELGYERDDFMGNFETGFSRIYELPGGSTVRVRMWRITDKEGAFNMDAYLEDRAATLNLLPLRSHRNILKVAQMIDDIVKSEDFQKTMRWHNQHDLFKQWMRPVEQLTRQLRFP